MNVPPMGFNGPQMGFDGPPQMAYQYQQPENSAMGLGNPNVEQYVPSQPTEKAPIIPAMSKKILCCELRYIMPLEILVAIAIIIIMIVAMATPEWLRQGDSEETLFEWEGSLTKLLEINSDNEEITDQILASDWEGDTYDSIGDETDCEWFLPEDEQTDVGFGLLDDEEGV